MPKTFPKIGLLGGGQLGRMLLQESINFPIEWHVIDPDAMAPCASIAHRFIQGSLMDDDLIVDSFEDCDIITIEIEHVSINALKKLVAMGKTVYPQPEVLALIQDKGAQKMHFDRHDIPTAPYKIYKHSDEILTWAASEFPCYIKTRHAGYDGRGVQYLQTLPATAQGLLPGEGYAEMPAKDATELAVIVATNAKGDVTTFPLIQMDFKKDAHMVEWVFSPTHVSIDIEKRAQSLALQVSRSLGIIGLLAVEMFLRPDGSLWVNEVAPRPHNSGHHFIESATYSQFSAHLRCLLNWPLPPNSMHQAAVMLNLIGEDEHSGAPYYEGLEDVLALPGCHVHLYGKVATKPNRKMGHITVTAPNLSAAFSLAQKAKQLIRVIAKN